MMTHRASLSCWETKSFQMTDCDTPRFIYAEWVWWKYGDLRTHKQAFSESAHSLGCSIFYVFHCFYCSVVPVNGEDCNWQLRSSYLRISKHARFLLIQQFGFSHGKQVSMAGGLETSLKSSHKVHIHPLSHNHHTGCFLTLSLWSSDCRSVCVFLSLYILQRSTDERPAGFIFAYRAF